MIALDEVKAGSVESLGEFRDWLEVYANEIAEYNRDYSRRGGSIAVIALTSNATTAKIWEEIDIKVNWALMWSLPRRASDDLVTQMGLQHRVAGELGINDEKAMEILWRLAGRNPRVLDFILAEGLNKWLEGEVLKRLTGLVERAGRDFGEKVWEELERASTDIDNADIDLIDLMLEKNIAIYIAGSDKISEIPSESWIGKEFAFQIPAYYYALKAMAKKRSHDVSQGDVIREAMD